MRRLLALCLLIGFVGVPLASGATQTTDWTLVAAQLQVLSQVKGTWTQPTPPPCSDPQKGPCSLLYKVGSKLIQPGDLVAPNPPPLIPIFEEILNATNTSFTAGAGGCVSHSDYSVTGIAMGPFPGTFTQTGSIDSGVLTGSLTITSPVANATVSMSGPLFFLACFTVGPFAFNGTDALGFPSVRYTANITPPSVPSYRDLGAVSVTWFGPFFSEVVSTFRLPEVAYDIAQPCPLPPCM